MEGHQANGAFVACGPPGFTALALINLGSQARKMSLVLPFSIRTFRPAVLTSLLSLLSTSDAVQQPSAARSRLSSRRRDLVLIQRAHRTPPLRPVRLLFRLWRATVLVQSPQAPQRDPWMSAALPLPSSDLSFTRPMN